MQLAIELPDELGNELLQQDNVTQFVQEAVKSRLLEVRQSNTQRNTFIKTMIFAIVSTMGLLT